MKRDLREETLLNSAEFQSLKHLSGKLGISKSAVLRFALNQLVDKFTRDEVRRDTGLVTED